MQVPQRTAVFPPAFSAMFPPMVQAQALVGSVAKTRPCSSASSIARSVTTPASSVMTAPSNRLPSSAVNVRLLDPADPVQRLGVDDDASASPAAPPRQ